LWLAPHQNRDQYPEFVSLLHCDRSGKVKSNVMRIKESEN
jgi:hypothetical protein